MKAKLFSLFLTAASLLLSLSAATSVRAEDLRVEHRGLYPTIQSAIDYAALQMRSPTSVSFRILVKADTKPYNGPITPINGVPIIGDSTENTFIEGGTGPLINLNNVTSVEIRNFTFQNAPVGISVANSSGINITNNVFQMGTGGTAIQVQNSSITRIVNSTFFNNGTAISTNSDIEISNNIFSNNQLAISDQVLLRVLTYNYFYANTANGVVSLDPSNIPNNRVTIQDPLFVNRGEDFHLQPESPAKGSGNPSYKNSFDTTSDMGAYGGPNSDIPLLVTGLSSRLVPPDRIALSWNQSVNTAVTAYRIYYGTAPGSYSGIQAAEGPSPILTLATSANLSDLPITQPPAPEAPSLTIRPLNQALQLDWNLVPGATGYEIYQSSTPFTPSALPTAFIPIEGGNTTSYRLPGLSNGTPYFVAVRAVAQSTVYAAVTAVIDSSISPNQGSSNESGYSNEIREVLSPAVKSVSSQIESATPEAITPNPNLPNKGCFIATAAYGFYDAPQVQVLRKFRDSYLMTNAPGRSFVAWYYQHGPRGAAFINVHPWLKLPVRLALLPLIAFAMFLVNTTPLVKLLVVVLAVLCTAHSIKRINVMRKIQINMLVQSGGQP